MSKLQSPLHFLSVLGAIFETESFIVAIVASVSVGFHGREKPTVGLFDVFDLYSFGWFRIDHSQGLSYFPPFPRRRRVLDHKIPVYIACEQQESELLLKEKHFDIITPFLHVQKGFCEFDPSQGHG